jgi:hypothetical protein
VADHAVLRDASGALRGLGEALLAQEVDRLVEIAARFLERRLAIHHARAGLVAKFFYLCRCRCCHFN